MKHPVFQAFLALLLSCAGPAAAQPGAPDLSFGATNGYVVTNFQPGLHASPNTMAILPNGRIVVVGSTWAPDNSLEPERISIARYMPNGSLDVTFGNGGKKTLNFPDYSFSGNSIALLPDGRMMVCGEAWNNDEDMIMLLRLNADGSPDGSFGGDGLVTYKVCNYTQNSLSIVVQSDGKLLVGGYANFTGYSEAFVMRFNANGTPDAGFGGGDGLVSMAIGESYSGVEKLMLQPDGKILAACHATLSGVEKFAMLRLLPNGTPDPSFSNDGYNIVSINNMGNSPESAVLQSDGKIVVAGGATINSNDKRMAAVRFLPNGSLDNGFGTGGMVLLDLDGPFEGAHSVAVQADGKIVLGGYVYDTDAYNSAIVRLLPNGQPDPGFGNQGTAIQSISTNSDWIYALAIQPDGKIVTAGSTWFSALHHFFVARYQNDVSVGVSSSESPEYNIRCFPNPAREQTTLSIDCSRDSQVFAVRLFDRQGRFVQHLLSPVQLPAGSNRLTLLFPAGLPGGTYILSVETDAGTRAIALVLQ